MSTDTTLDSLVNDSPIFNELYKSKEILVTIMEKIRIFLDHEIFCDVTLIAKDNETKIIAHKLVLSAASKYFLSMFGGSLQKYTQKELRFPNIDGRSLKCVINYIYTASIELTSDTVEEIAKIAFLLELESLKELCCKFLSDHLDASNCLGVLLFAEQNNLDKLYDISKNYVCQNFDKVRYDKAFFDLDVGHLSIFLSSSSLQVESEEHVFECIMSWIEHDKERRVKFTETLLLFVRLSQISPMFIAKVIEPACNSINCERFMHKALKWHFLPDLRSSLFSDKYLVPRQSMRNLIAISGWSIKDHHDYLHVGSYNFRTNEWTYTNWPTPPVRRDNFQTTVLGGKLIVAGGYTNFYNDNNTNNCVVCFDLENLKWTDMAPMQSKRYGFGMAALDDCIYVFGGFDRKCSSSETPLRSMEKWDSMTRTWIYIPHEKEILSKSYCKHLAAKQKTLCAAEETLDQQIVYHIYDPYAVTWNTHWWSSTSSHLGFGTVRSEEKELFVIVSRDSILKYDDEDDTKVIVDIEKIEDEYTNCQMFADHIVIFGDKQFKIYYPFTDEWRTIPSFDNIRGRVVLMSNY